MLPFSRIGWLDWNTDLFFQAGPIDTKALNHVSLNEPFPVKMEIRSPAHEALILREHAKAIREEEER